MVESYGPAHRIALRRIACFLGAGAAGYGVNLAVYALALRRLGFDYRLSAVSAFLAAVATTFALNRRFTFAVTGGALHRQAVRYLAVSIGAFIVSLGVLELLVRSGVGTLAAGPVAVAVAAPVNYTGQRRWAFPADEPAPRAPSRVPVATALAGIVALAAVLRLWGLGHEGLWYDEGMTAWLVRGTPGQLLGAVPKTESTPPLYYLLTWGWVHLFGETVTGLRTVSALAGIATVPAAFLAGRALAGTRVGLVTALLVAANPLLVWFSRDARSYALLSLLTALSIWLFVRARERAKGGWLAAWAAVASLALCTHYFAAFIVAPEAALLLVAARRRDVGRRLAAIGVVGATGIALLGLVERQRGAHTLWFTFAPLGRRVDQLAREFAVGFTPPAGLVAVAAVAAAAALALIHLVLRGDARERHGAVIAALLGLCAIGLPLALAAGGTDYFNTRNTISAVVPAAIVLAAGAGARRAAPVGLIAAAVPVVVGVAMVHTMATDYQAQRPDLAAVGAVLRRPAIRGRHVILIRGRRTWEVPLRFYLPPAWWLADAGTPVREIDALRRVPDRHECPNQTTWGAFCDIGAQPPLRRPPVRGFRLRTKVRVAGFEVARYVAPRPIRVYPRRPFGRPAAQPGAPRKMLLLPSHAPVVPR